MSRSYSNPASVVDVITKRIKTNGIIWVVIAAIQIMMGLAGAIWVLIVGILNMVSALQDLNYCSEFPKRPVGIVAKMRPITGDIITLLYNLIFGGVIGVVGSIYYLVSVRGYVLENEKTFLEIENQYIN